MKTFFVYILTNQKNGTLYIGVTSNLQKRIDQHKTSASDGFSKKYGLDKLVYVEQYESSISAIEREKQLKRWHRSWKINLIEKNNPDWADLSKYGIY